MIQKMKKQLDFLEQYEVEFQGWQRRSSGKFFTRIRPRIHQPSKSFGLTLATETTFNSNFCSKTARYRLFLAVVRCCVITTLAAETFGLLNVYLNYKFQLSLPSFYLFFQLVQKQYGVHESNLLNIYLMCFFHTKYMFNTQFLKYQYVA